MFARYFPMAAATIFAALSVGCGPHTAANDVGIEEQGDDAINDLSASYARNLVADPGFEKGTSGFVLLGGPAYIIESATDSVKRSTSYPISGQASLSVALASAASAGWSSTIPNTVSLTQVNVSANIRANQLSDSVLKMCVRFSYGDPSNTTSVGPKCVAASQRVGRIAYRTVTLFLDGTHPGGRIDVWFEKTGTSAVRYSIDNLVVQVKANKTQATPLPNVINLESSFTATGFSLAWYLDGAPTTPEKYVIYRSTQETTGFVSVATANFATPPSTRYRLFEDALPSGAPKFYYRVTAADPITGAESAPSNTVSVSVGPDPTPPLTIVSLAVSYDSNTSILVRWVPNSMYNGATFKVYRAKSKDGPFAPIATTSDVSYEDTQPGVGPGSNYYYVVSVSPATGAEGAPSDTVSIDLVQF